MFFKKTLLSTLLLCTSLYSVQCGAVVNSGWNISSSYVWRLLEDSDYSFEHGSPAKIIQLDRNIMNRQAVFKVQKSITNRYSFKVGCLYQSATPAFELDISSLDVKINDQFRGYVFARYMVDSGQEYSLRAEILPPSRLVFAPITKSQDSKLSDLFMQLSEGGVLKIAVLQGKHDKPRVFSIRLEGFFDLSKTVLEDCKRLNAIATKIKPFSFLPDYLTKEPADAAMKDYSLKPPLPNDGLTPPNTPQPAAEEKPEQETAVEVKEPEAAPQPPEEKEEPQEVPDVQLFTPGGGEASIGDDGKPITASPDGNTSDLGTSKGEMKIGDDGAPVSN